jgi:hypothetical protein
VLIFDAEPKKLRTQEAPLFCVFVFRLGGVAWGAYTFSTGAPMRNWLFVF